MWEKHRSVRPARTAGGSVNCFTALDADWSQRLALGDDAMADALMISESADDVTRALAYYAHQLGTELGSRARHLHDQAAPDIIRALNPGQERAVFFFLHGTNTPQAEIVHGSGTPVVDLSTAHRLKNRIVCATCYSLGDLGDEIANRQNGTMIGYLGKMHVPYGVSYVQDMRDAALAAHRALALRQSAGAASDAARDAYHDLALAWTAEGIFTSFVLAGTVADHNARAVGMKGDANAETVSMARR